MERQRVRRIKAVHGRAREREDNKERCSRPRDLSRPSMILHRCWPRLQLPVFLQSRAASTAASPTPNLRNLAVVAHIGRFAQHISWMYTHMAYCRFRKDYAYRVYPVPFRLPQGLGYSRHRQHGHRLSARRTRSRHHHPVGQRSGPVERLSYKPNRHARTRQLRG